MNVIKTLFDVFSRRQPALPIEKIKQLTAEFRNRTLMLCRDEFVNPQTGDHRIKFWAEIHHRLTYLHGKPQLSPQPPDDSPMGDALSFLFQCKDEHFLDFVEYIFKVEQLWRAKSSPQDIVSYINEFLLLDDLPYYLTDYLTETKEEDWHGTKRRVTSVVGFPQVIRRDHGLIHNQAIAPVLALLKDPRFKSANHEFLEALNDYRKGDYGDCLTKCGSSLESAMKIICNIKDWTFQESQTAGPLLKVIIDNSGIHPFFEQPLLIIATIRNRLSKSHGAGIEPRVASPTVAQYAVNMTASAIVFLVSELI